VQEQQVRSCRYITPVILFVLTEGVVGSDQIILKDGTGVTGRITMRTAESVSVVPADGGRLRVIKQSEIARIDGDKPDAKTAASKPAAAVERIIKCEVLRKDMLVDDGPASPRGKADTRAKLGRRGSRQTGTHTPRGGNQSSVASMTVFPVVELRVTNVSVKNIALLWIKATGSDAYLKNVEADASAVVTLRGKGGVITARGQDRDAALEQIQERVSQSKAPDLLLKGTEIWATLGGDAMTKLRTVLEDDRLYGVFDPTNTATRKLPDASAMGQTSVIDVKAARLAAQDAATARERARQDAAEAKERATELERRFQEQVAKREQEGSGPRAVAEIVVEALKQSSGLVEGKFGGLYYIPLDGCVTPDEERQRAQARHDVELQRASQGNYQGFVRSSELAPKMSTTVPSSDLVGLVYEFTYISKAGLPMLNRTGRVIVRRNGDQGYEPYACCVDGITKIMYGR